MMIYPGKGGGADGETRAPLSITLNPGFHMGRGQSLRACYVTGSDNLFSSGLHFSNPGICFNSKSKLDSTRLGWRTPIPGFLRSQRASKELVCFLEEFY